LGVRGCYHLVLIWPLGQPQPATGCLHRGFADSLHPGLVLKAHRLVYHSTLGCRVIKKKTPESPPSTFGPKWLSRQHSDECGFPVDIRTKVVSPSIVKRKPFWSETTPVRKGERARPSPTLYRCLSLNTAEFIPHEHGSPFGWIEPEIAQYHKST